MHWQLPSDGGTNTSVLIGPGLRLFVLKVEQKVFIKAKNSSGGSLFFSFKTVVVLQPTFRDLNREAIYQTAP